MQALTFSDHGPARGKSGRALEHSSDTAPSRPLCLLARARSTPWFALSVLPRSLRTSGGFRCPRRPFLTKSYPTMRHIKPVALFRLVCRFAQDRFRRGRRRSLCPFPPSRTLAFFVPPSSSFAETNVKPSIAPECVAWNGQSAILSSRVYTFKPSVTVASEISTGVVGYAAVD